MKINKLIKRAERHSKEASRWGREFGIHADSSLDIARSLLATPLGMSACFGLGAAVGATTASQDEPREDDRPARKSSKTKDVLADTGTRLASALIVGALMKASDEPPQDDASPDTS